MADLPLEEELVLLGRTLATGPVPDVRASVTAAVCAETPRPARRWNLRRRIAATVAAIAVALTGALVVSPAARAAAVRVLSFVGIDLVGAPAPAPPGPGTLPSQRQAPLDEVRRQVRFPVLAPASLGPPVTVAVSDGGRVVTLTYRSGVRLDESGDKLGAFFTKYVDPAVAEYVQVGGYSGIWVNRAHEVAYVGADGVPKPETVRLAARTLLIDRNAVTVRLEGAATLEQALEIASTLR